MMRGDLLDRRSCAAAFARVGLAAALGGGAIIARGGESWCDKEEMRSAGRSTKVGPGRPYQHIR